MIEAMTAPPARLRRIDIDTLPAHVRTVLDGVEDLLVYELAMNVRFRRVTSRNGLLLRGENGWAEAAPFWDYAPGESSTWLAGALDVARHPQRPTLRTHVPVNVTIPVVSPDSARERVLNSQGCKTAKVKVADPGARIEDDCARVRAVAEALAETSGEGARVRVDANAAWSVAEAVRAIEALDEAAASLGGLYYVEQPCATVSELAEVRQRVHPLIAADESIRRASDPQAVAREGAADIAVVKIAPLGGIERALSIAEETGLQLVVSSALESAIGLSVGVRAAASIPGEVLACGLATGSFFAADVVREPLRVREGALPVRTDLEPDLELLRNPVSDDVYERWTQRLDAMSIHLQEAP